MLDRKITDIDKCGFFSFDEKFAFGLRGNEQKNNMRGTLFRSPPSPTISFSYNYLQAICSLQSLTMNSMAADTATTPLEGLICMNRVPCERSHATSHKKAQISRKKIQDDTVIHSKDPSGRMVPIVEDKTVRPFWNDFTKEQSPLWRSAVGVGSIDLFRDALLPKS